MMYQFPWNAMATQSEKIHNNYVSCIRYKGIPVLPPVMTQERIVEMRKFKQLAIDVENRLKLGKKLQILSANENFNQSPSSPNDSFDIDFIEELKVPENDVTPIESSTLNVPDNSPNIEDIESINEIYAKNDDSDEISSSSHSKKSVSNNLSEPDVPLDDSIPCKPLESENENILEQNLVTFNSNCPDCVASPPVLNDHNGEDKNQEKQEQNEKTVPRLLRQNSYIIETPSPMLLAFIDNQLKGDDLQSNKSSHSESKERRRSCWDLINAREKWSSLEKDINAAAFTPIQRKIKSKKNSSLPSSVPVSPAKQMFDSRTPKPIEKNPSSAVKTRKERPNRNLKTPQSAKCLKRVNKESSKTKLAKSKSFVIEKRNDSTKDNISRPTNAIESAQICSEIPSVNELSKIEKPKLEDKAKELYLAIQYEHSRLMKELMIRYKKEQENLIRRFNEQHMLIVNQLKMNSSTPTLEYLSESTTQRSENTEFTERVVFSAREKAFDNLSSINGTNFNNTLENLEIPDLSARKDEELNFSDGTSSQTINLNFSTTPSAMIEFSNDIMNLENNNRSSEMEIVQKDQYIPLNSSFNGNNNYIHHQAVQIFYSSNNEVPVKSNIVASCNRELFPVKDKLISYQYIQAATVIQAAVRGYLVRRLLRTERVQSLITTIRDTLLCALELQREDIDNIQPADVELHRCLINQLTAACYGIHDIFFTLTIPERMSIITIDRQRLQERLLRPSSARSNPSLTTTTKRFLERKHLKSASSCMVPQGSSPTMKRLCKSASSDSKVTDKTFISSNSEIFSTNSNSRRNFQNSSNKRPWR